MAVEGWVTSDGTVVASALLDERRLGMFTVMHRCLDQHTEVVRRSRGVFLAMATGASVEVACLDEGGVAIKVTTVRPWRGALVLGTRQVVVAPRGVLTRANVSAGSALEFKAAA